MVLDFGGGFEESSTDDDGGVAGDVGIDMRKLLSSSSQTGGSCGPNLNRQLMTHLRLLQADLQYLKVLRMSSSAAAMHTHTHIIVYTQTTTSGGKSLLEVAKLLLLN